jgi:hypothetical protein
MRGGTATKLKRKGKPPMGAKKGRLKGDFQKGIILSKRTMA